MAEKPVENSQAASEAASEAAVPEAAVPAAAAGAEETLDPFLKRHKFSSLGTRMVNDQQQTIVLRPWDDPTIIFAVSDLEAQADVLNNVLLPRRLTAVWHIDSGDIEVIWTAYRLSADQSEIAGRAFEFVYEGESYQCEFGASSDRLLALAKMVQPVSNPSETQFRNMVSFSTYATAETGSARRQSVDTPRSFWIRGVKLNEKSIIPLIDRLNFYLSYYDERSPIVMVHGEPEGFTHQRTRYPVGSFPTFIASRPLDENMISFWEAARKDNEVLQFILYYRIIEYAGYHYVGLEARETILRILRDPARGHDGDKALQGILAALDANSMGGDERFVSILERHVAVETIWREIELNRNAFSRDQEFDGGFKLDALVGKKETIDGFRNGGVIRFATAMRKVRNVLAHGRDQKTGTVITPSLRNLRMLRPWVAIIAAAAGEIVMYEPPS